MAMFVELGKEHGKRRKVECAGWADASSQVRDYIEANNLGSGSGAGSRCLAFTGGKVFEGETQIGRISYNGRAWDMQGAEVDRVAA